MNLTLRSQLNRIHDCFRKTHLGFFTKSFIAQLPPLERDLRRGGKNICLRFERGFHPRGKELRDSAFSVPGTFSEKGIRPEFCLTHSKYELTFQTSMWKRKCSTMHMLQRWWLQLMHEPPSLWSFMLWAVKVCCNFGCDWDTDREQLCKVLESWFEKINQWTRNIKSQSGKDGETP